MARLEAKPLNLLLPAILAALAIASARPATRQNTLPILSTIRSQASTSRKRCFKIGARWSGIPRRLSDRICRPVKPTRYFFAF